MGDLPRSLQASLLRIRGEHPYFGVLALFAEFEISERVETAATDGKRLWFNPRFIEGLAPAELSGVVVHELLHAALQHGVRRAGRDPLAWNIAADIVVNGVVRSATKYKLPAGAIEDRELEHLCVEEVYEQLLTRAQLPVLLLVDLLPPGALADTSRRQQAGEGGIEHTDGWMQSRAAELRRHWQAAMHQAAALARRSERGFGNEALSAFRDFGSATEAALSWHQLLWQHLISTPYDFGGFDRRFVYRALYVEDMVGETVNVAVCVDTSGSIGAAELDAFMAEVQGILDAYPHIKGTLSYADARLYGPYPFSLGHPLPEAQGGGGTDFRPFFEWLEQRALEGDAPLGVYLTDGLGSFPSRPPKSPVIWVVCTGGLESGAFPFGEVVRMAI